MSLPTTPVVSNLRRLRQGHGAAGRSRPTRPSGQPQQLGRGLAETSAELWAERGVGAGGD